MIMKPKLLGLCAAIVASLPFATSASANKAVEPSKFAYNTAKGYILIRVGPVAKPKSKTFPLVLARLGADGKAVWQFGGMAVDSKKNLDAAMLWSSKHWGNDGTSNLYLAAVNPGRWVIGAANNTTFSLGSYAFDVAPGRITYVGTVLMGQENGKSEIPEIRDAVLSEDLRTFGTLVNVVMSDTFVLRRPTSADPIPEPLQAIGVVPAEIENDVRFDNFMRSLVGRAADLPRTMSLGGEAVAAVGATQAAPAAAQTGTVAAGATGSIDER